MTEFEVDVDCPECRYPVWVRLSEVAALCYVVCPCCRVRIRLLDAGGGAQNLDCQINQVMRKMQNEVDRMLRGLPG